MGINDWLEVVGGYKTRAEVAEHHKQLLISAIDEISHNVATDKDINFNGSLNRARAFVTMMKPKEQNEYSNIGHRK